MGNSSAYNAAYRQAHPEKWRAAKLRARQRDIEHVRAKGREYEHRRRARAHGVRCEPVSIRLVFDRDAGRCHICGKSVKWEIPYPNPRSKSIDHLVPLGRGGPHEMSNVALAHLSCNKRRGADRIAAQLLLKVAA